MFKNPSNRLLLITGLVIAAISFSTCQLPRGAVQDIPQFSPHYKTFVETLASDAFEGRAPTTAGGKMTKDYIESEFKRMGLKPGNGDSYRQAVPLVELTASNFSNLLITQINGETLSFSYLDQMVSGTQKLTSRIDLRESELVFAGYGIVAPEYNWNDYEGLDVRGKTVIVLVNDPGYTLGNDTLFTGRAMTYYGRWTYKYEEAARQGAAGVFIVHETGPAGYGWDVVRNSWSGPQYQVGGESQEPEVEVQGWLQKNVADQIFKMAGMTLDEAKEMALRQEFSPVSLNLNASVHFDVDFIQSQSYNIVGYVEGSEFPEETVIYMAHWDHLGKERSPEGVEIYNGAIDNATGTAAIMAIAERFATMQPAPRRSVVFIAVTAEESGLIGSAYYAQNPLFPLETTVGGINIDGLNVYGPTHDVMVVGFGTSEMQEYLERHAAAQDRVLVPEDHPERGYFYRSDHFNLVRQGVPMIYANSGRDFIGRTADYADFVEQDLDMRYHSSDDVVNDNWDWRGLDQNLWLFFYIGADLANNRNWPEWYEGTEFKATRDVSRQRRVRE
jgi:Zn-dependent M28 family amino/carboxypeptidase